MQSTGLRSGQCPICAARDVYCDDNYSVRAPVGMGVHVARLIVLASSIWRIKYAAIQTYVCGTCGYIERYVANQPDLDYIKSKWRRVGEKTKRKNDE